MQPTNDVSLTEPVLDVGCGDGRFLQLGLAPGCVMSSGLIWMLGLLIWPKHSGVYREVLVTPANRLPFAPQRFASAFC